MSWGVGFLEVQKSRYESGLSIILWRGGGY